MKHPTSKQKKALVLEALAKHGLMDDGGPVLIAIPVEPDRTSKLDTKARELRRRAHSYWPDRFDARPIILHLIKLGKVKRRRDVCGRRGHTYFELVDKPVTDADKIAALVAVIEDFLPESVRQNTKQVRDALELANKQSS